MISKKFLDNTFEEIYIYFFSFFIFFLTNFVPPHSSKTAPPSQRPSLRTLLLCLSQGLKVWEFSLNFCWRVQTLGVETRRSVGGKMKWKWHSIVSAYLIGFKGLNVLEARGGNDITMLKPIKGIRFGKDNWWRLTSKKFLSLWLLELFSTQPILTAVRVQIPFFYVHHLAYWRRLIQKCSSLNKCR